MKAFLLAGGLGTRLFPLTENQPKCLLPVRGVPMLQIWFDICRRYGIDEILINVHRHADMVKQFVKDYRGSLKVRVFEEATLLGSAGTVQANSEWVGEDPSFWIFYADVLTTLALNQLLEFHNRLRQVATIGVSEVPNPSRCGIVRLDANGIVCEFVEKPSKPKSNLAFSGLMIGTQALLKKIPTRCPVDFGFDVLPELVDQMAGFRIRDFLIDIGTPEGYEAAQAARPVMPDRQFRE